jgi:hypothetical protein
MNMRDIILFSAICSMLFDRTTSLFCISRLEDPADDGAPYGVVGDTGYADEGGGGTCRWSTETAVGVAAIPGVSPIVVEGRRQWTTQ